MDRIETDLCTRAEALMKRRRFAEAIPMFKQHLRGHGEDLGALLKLGICHLLNRGEQAFLDIHQRARRVVAKLKKMPADVARLWAQYGDLVKQVTATALVLGVTATVYSGHRYSAGVRPRPVPTQSAHASSGEVHVESTTQEVKAIKSLAQLRKVPPAAVILSWEIRIGVADLPDDKARPWLLLYCHVRNAAPAAGIGHLGPPTQMYSGAELLGPVSFIVATTESLGARKKIKITAPKAPAAGRKDVERLYVAAIPVVAKQATNIFVHWGNAGQLIAKWQRPAGEAHPCPWMPFAAVGAKGFVVADEFQAAWPTYPRRVPLWRLVKGEGFALPRPVAGKLVRYFLPGCVRGDAPYYEPRYYGEKTDAGVKRKEPFPLKLSISAGAFAIGSKVRLVNRPDEYLLARWWVNGKAVVPPAPKAKTGSQEEKARTETVTGTKEMKVALRLPTYLGRLKAGDKVTLQVMHCDGGYSRLSGEAVAQLVNAWPAFAPMLSNELTFTVTREMLPKGAGRSKEKRAVASGHYQGGLHLRMRDQQPARK